MTTGKILGNKYLINGNTADVRGFFPDMSADIYYEVVRLMDGKVLFLYDHLERLQQSLSGTGIEYPGRQRIMENLALLVASNSFMEGNIRISLERSRGQRANLLCYFIPYFYPEATMYEHGVKLLVYPHVRPNPGIKKWDDSFRNSVAGFIQKHKIYEVALKNPQNQITEGSRSNIFFITAEGSLVTPPGVDVLRGITRKYIMDIASEEKIQVLERHVATGELGSMEAVFITGTSPKVLPVQKVDRYCFDVAHPMLRILMGKFDVLVQNNLTVL